jgi:hypothetical protein
MFVDSAQSMVCSSLLSQAIPQDGRMNFASLIATKKNGQVVQKLVIKIGHG